MESAVKFPPMNAPMTYVGFVTYHGLTRVGNLILEGHRACLVFKATLRDTFLVSRSDIEVVDGICRYQRRTYDGIV